MTTTPDWLNLNRANWDERVPLHLNAPDVYALAPLRDGSARLGPIASEILGPVSGLRVLHLQCHFGLDTLTIAQQGARAIGLDFSAPAIAAARDLARETNLSDAARFVEANVYDALSALPEPGTFDRVFVSWGALNWLPDLFAWARVVAAFLRPGGYLALAEAHPMAYVFDDLTATPDGRPGWYAAYLERAPLLEDRPEDYADPAARLRNSRTVECVHPLSDLFMALIAAGLRIERFHEHDRAAWRMFSCQTRHGPGDYRWPDKPWLPLSYSLRAVKG